VSSGYCERYTQEVKAYRRRSASVKSALVVVLDADREEVPKRVSRLQDELVRANLGGRKRDEHIVHLIPRRAIETWVLCLSGLEAQR
jgi:hypothetical protein